MQKRIFILTVLAGMVLSEGGAFAQNPADQPTSVKQQGMKRIYAQVLVADNKEPIVGALVKVIGTNKKGVTDIDGNFSFELPSSGKYEVEISSTGMKTLRVMLKPDMKILLEYNDNLLGDVIVNGFFSRQKQTFTGAARTIKSEELLNISPTNLFQALSTIDPGIVVAQNNALGSDPNTVPDLVLRSTTSLATNNEVGLNAPLVVIDGVESSLQALYDIDIQDIERVDILKDAAASALYGENAANGVIIIERKKVSQAPVRVRYTLTPEFSFADLGSYNLTNAAQKLELERLSGLYDSNTGSLDQRYYDKLSLISRGIDTDWKSKPIRNSFSHSHSISVSGRGAGLDYNVTGNFSDVNGVMKDDLRRRYGMNMYLSYTTFTKLILTLRASHDQLNVRHSKYGAFSDYLMANPYDSPYDEMGNYRRSLSYERNNPLYEASLSSFHNSEMRTQKLSLDARYNFKPNFYVTLQGAYTTGYGTSDRYVSPESNYFTSVNTLSQKGSYALGNNGLDEWSAKMVSNYIRSFDNDGTMLTLNIGAEIKRQNSYSRSLMATGFLSDSHSDIAYATAYPEGQAPYGSESLAASLGGFVSANFMWKNRYVIDGSYRVSGSSKFGQNHRYAPFWAVGLGYNMHNEKFIKNLGWVNTLRLRGSYGYTGSVKFAAYQAVTTYRYRPDLATYTGVGAVPIAMSNPDLKWQTTKKFNLGLTSSLFNDRVNFNFDYFRDRTDDMLIDMSLPPSSGAVNVKSNLGSQTSQGFEFGLWAKVLQVKDLGWSVSINGLHARNIINNISDALKRKNEENANNNASPVPLLQFREGESPTAIYAVRSAGIDPASGKEIFIKKDGSYTYYYSASDQVSVGDATPRLQGNVSSQLTYKRLSLSLNFSYRIGGHIYNSTRAAKIENIDPKSNADVRAFTERWKSPGDIVPYLGLSKVGGQSFVYTERFVERNDELWFSSMQVRYEVPEVWLGKAGLQKMYLSLGTEDLFRFGTAKYERGTLYPYSRSVNLSMSVTF